MATMWRRSELHHPRNPGRADGVRRGAVVLVALGTTLLGGCVGFDWMAGSDWVMKNAQETFGGAWAAGDLQSAGAVLDTIVVVGSDVSEKEELTVFVDVVYDHEDAVAAAGESRIMARRHFLTFSTDWRHLSWKFGGHSSPPMLNNYKAFFVGVPNGGKDGIERWRKRR